MKFSSFVLAVAALYPTADASRASKKIERQLQDVVDECGGCEPSQFCGRDDLCHTTNCENLYLYDFEFNSTDLVPLECNSAPFGAADRSYLTIAPVCDFQMPYGLTMFTANGQDSDLCGNDPGNCGLIPGIPFTRKCFAEPLPWRRFVCYDTDPTLDTQSLVGDYLAFANNITAQGYTPLHVVTKAYGYRQLGSALVSNTTDSITDMVRYGIFADWDIGSEDEYLRDQRFPPEHPGFPSCLNGCGFHEFCGRDGLCHEQTCSNMYDFGPLSMLNYDETTIPKGELVCTDNELQTIDGGIECEGNPRTPWPIAAFFQCQVSKVLNTELGIETLDYSHDSCWTSDIDNRYISFDRMCTAKNDVEQFECYEVIDGKASSEAYLQAVSAFDGQCSKDTLNTDYALEVFAGVRDVSDTDVAYDGRTVYGTCSRDLAYKTNGEVGSVGFCDIRAGSFCSQVVQAGRLDFVIYSQVKLTSAAWGVAPQTTMIVMTMVGLLGWLL